MTKKQKMFCEEYLIDLNATQAAIRAGYSTKTAYSIGCEVLKHPEVRARIDKALAERSKRTGINAERVLLELARIGYANATDLVDMATAKIKEGASRDDSAVISSIKVKYIPIKTVNEDGKVEVAEGVEREIRFADKLKALDLLARHLGLMDKKPEAEDTAETGVVLLPEIEQEPVNDGEPDGD